MAAKDSFEEDWRLVSPYLDEVLSIEPTQRQAWLQSLASRAPKVSELIRDHLERLHELHELHFMEAPAPSSLNGKSGPDYER
jgi:hypothetical protein